MNDAQIKGLRAVHQAMTIETATIERRTQAGFSVRVNGLVIGVSRTYAGARELLDLHFAGALAGAL